MASKIDLKLSADEALVLFEYLSARFADGGEASLTAEEVALNSVLGQLESTLAEPFAANYPELVAAARARLTSES